MGKEDERDQPAEIVREYGPYPGASHVRGVTFDGSLVWFAAGEKLQAFEPESGKSVRALDVACDAGTAFDGRHLFQIADNRIHKIDPATGKVLSTIPAPGGGRDSGLTWAEGTLWVGQYRDRKIHQIDPDTGAILRTRAVARDLGGPRRGHPPGRPEHRRGPDPADHARPDGGQRPRVGRTRPVLRRRRRQRAHPRRSKAAPASQALARACLSVRASRPRLSTSYFPASRTALVAPLISKTMLLIFAEPAVLSSISVPTSMRVSHMSVVKPG